MAISAKTNILIVDGIREMREMLRETIKKIGLKNVQIADSQAMALEKISDGIKSGKKIQLIFSEYDLPDGNGVDLHNKLKDNGHINGVNYILTLSEGGHEFVKEAVQNGIRHVMIKPFSRDDIVDKLAKIYK